MTTLEIILSLVSLGLATSLALSIVRGVRALESVARDYIIALTYIRDAAEFRTVDEFAETFLAEGADAAAEQYEEFGTFRKEWIAAERAGDAA